MRRLTILALVLLLAACAGIPHGSGRIRLQLAPATLGTPISLQQHLVLERGGRTDHFEAALEVDAQHVAMVGLTLGQRVMSLDYDGATLRQWRHPMFPDSVRGEDVLEDIQLTYWPAAAIRAALPRGWRIEENARQRTLWMEDTRVMQIDYSAQPPWSGTVTLSNLRHGYRLIIQSVTLEP